MMLLFSIITITTTLGTVEAVETWTVAARVETVRSESASRPNNKNFLSTVPYYPCVKIRLKNRILGELSLSLSLSLYVSYNTGSFSHSDLATYCIECELEDGKAKVGSKTLHPPVDLRPFQVEPETHLPVNHIVKDKPS